MPGSSTKARVVGARQGGLVDPAVTAKAVGLRYVSDETPGIGRRKVGKTFVYFAPDGQIIADEPTLERIRSLAIPPAYKDVWICPRADGHLQATGRDARGRKQYRYHPDFRAAREEAKYEHMQAFAEALPTVRARTDEHLRLRGLPREKVLAAVVRIMEKTLIRVGNEEYARTNESFGLTTLLDEHAEINGSTVRFEFAGKHGVEHEIDLADPRLAKIVEKCQELPGQELFQYLDAGGAVIDVKSEDVNAYLREITGQPFTAKDFRTWAGTVLAARALAAFERFDSKAQAKKNVVQAVEAVAKRLGNTRTVCRKCYIHPTVIDTYLDGGLAERLATRAGEELVEHLGELPPEEAAVLGMLRASLERPAPKNVGNRTREREEGWIKRESRPQRTLRAGSRGRS